MSLFGIPIWRLILIVVLILLVIKRANIVAMFAKWKYSKGDYFGSLKIFRMADKIGNLNIGNKILLGYNCLRCGELDAARKIFNQIIMLTKRGSADRFRTKSLLALVEWKDGNLNEAIELMEEIFEDGYKNTNMYQNLGILYNLKGNGEQAVKFNLEGYEYNKDDNIIADNLADAYAINGEYERSAEIYEELINRDPEPRFPEAYYGYGKVLIQLGEKERGLELIRKALEKPYSFLSIRSKEEIEKLYEELK